MENKHNRNKHNDIHEHLTGEHKWNHTGQLSLLLVFSISLLMDLLIFNISTWFQNIIPLFIRIIVSIPILILSYYLINKSTKTIFNQNQDESTIIKSGIYSKVRHPIYLAPIIMYLGIIILSLSIIVFIIWIPIIIFYYNMGKYEERLLLDKFGNEYEKYMNDVPMFIPKIRINKQN
jgi:protein-S-isoprenylcysteine O-methyltransferase Ste14